MSNQPITDMIETIERYAQLQPDYPVYNVLGEEHTYGQLKADSDSLAAHIGTSRKVTCSGLWWTRI